ncbi:MAG TPA: protein kinase [Kofleriaceae bacterium]|nr:protein kinase [Kofleriaceae bacterium]
MIDAVLRCSTEVSGMADHDLDLAGCTLGDFVLIEKIGEGGYGAVYRCQQRGLQRSAVIKVLHARQRDSEVARERFQREAHLASHLHHPYAAHVYAFGVAEREHEELLWIAMELVDGVSLSAWLQSRGPMSLEQFVPFFERLADVVQAAHRRGIIHRDLKPSNVMVTVADDGRLLPKLIDFGIAKASPELAPVLTPMPDAGWNGSLVERAADDGPPRRRTLTPPEHLRPYPRTITDSQAAAGPGLTPRGVPFGSLPYMSPEQWTHADNVGPAADVYSLGVVAYEALTGSTPFRCESVRSLHRQHLYDPVPSLHGPFSPDLNRILQRALGKQPHERHDSAVALAADFRAVLQASEREILRTSAQQWDARGRTPSLLLAGEVLADVQRLTRDLPSGALNSIECSYIAVSQRRARHLAWLRRALLVLAAMGAFGWFQYRAEQRAELARQVTEATITQAELEQGRAALLHGEPEAALHLGRAYERGDHSPSTAFMYARALQPRMAEQLRFASSAGRMWSAAFSPDGKQLVTTDDKNAQLWDAQTGRLEFTLPHGGVVYQAVYTANGTKLVTASADGAVRIWEAASGALVRELRRGDATPQYYAVAVSPDDKLVAAIDVNGGLVHIWEAANGALIADLRNDAWNSPAIAFSADARWLATTGGNDVHIFDTRTRTPAGTIRGPRIHSLAFDPTGPRLVTGAATGDAAIWEVPSGTRIHHLHELGDPVEAVAYSPDGRLVVTATRDGTEQIWRATSGEMQSLRHLSHGRIYAIEFDRASEHVLAANGDGTAVVTDIGLRTPANVLEGPQEILWRAHFDPSAHRVVGVSTNGAARIWDATAPYRRWSVPAMADDCGIVTTAEPDGRFIAVGCRDKATHVWDTARNELLGELPPVSPVPGDFTSAFPAVSATGDRAAIARGNTIEVFELPGGRLLRTIRHGAPVNAVAFSSVGRDLVSGAIDGSLLVTQDSGRSRTLPSAAAGIDAAAVLSDGRVISADAHGRLRIYDSRGTIRAELALPMRVMSLRIEGAHLVTVPSYFSLGAPPVLIDLEHDRIVAPLEGHTGRVFSARWVAGHQILTAGGDGTARLWDGATGQLRQLYRGGSRLLTDASLTSDGMVMAGGIDGALHFWDPASGRRLWALPVQTSQIIGIHVEGDDIVTRGFAGELSRWKLPKPGDVIEACGGQYRRAIVPR